MGPPYLKQRKEAMKYKVCVELKKEILNPEARAICETIQRKGFSNLSKLGISKNFHLEFDDKTEEPLSKIKELAENYLSNPISENYTITKIEEDA